MFVRSTVARSLLRSVRQRAAVQSFHAGRPLNDEQEEQVDAAAESSDEPGFLAASMGDWPRAVPLGALLSVPFIANNWYIMNEETQILGCFCLFTGSIYSLFGDAIGAHFDEDGKAIMAEHNAIEDVNIAAVDSVKETHAIRATVAEDVAAIAEASKALMHEIATAKTLQLKHDVRADFVRKLDYIGAQENALRESLQTSVVEAASESVRAQFVEGGDKMRADAFKAAMDALAGNPAPTDAVADAYTSFLKGFGERLAAAKDQEFDLPANIVAEIQDDMDALLRRENLRLEVTAPTKAKLGDF
jgi:F0F1-type ATP synthase membrane subunit b/b'